MGSEDTEAAAKASQLMPLFLGIRIGLSFGWFGRGMVGNGSNNERWLGFGGVGGVGTGSLGA